MHTQTWLICTHTHMVNLHTHILNVHTFTYYQKGPFALDMLEVMVVVSFRTHLQNKLAFCSILYHTFNVYTGGSRGWGVVHPARTPPNESLFSPFFLALLQNPGSAPGLERN